MAKSPRLTTKQSEALAALREGGVLRYSFFGAVKRWRRDIHVYSLETTKGAKVELSTTTALVILSILKDTGELRARQKDCNEHHYEIYYTAAPTWQEVQKKDDLRQSELREAYRGLLLQLKSGSILMEYCHGTKPKDYYVLITNGHEEDVDSQIALGIIVYHRDEVDIVETKRGWGIIERRITHKEAANA